jgi:hypothetical protein
MNNNNSNVSINGTVPIEDTLYISNDNTTYSMLNQININSNSNNNYFILNTTYCIETFTITNPYTFTYFLKIGEFIFPNFTNDIPNRVSTFILSEYNNIIPHVGPDVYIDNNVYKRIQIMYGNNYFSTNLNPNYVDITITGFELVDTNRIPIIRVFRKYFSSNTLVLNSPTDSIDIYGSCVLNRYNNDNNNYGIELSLNNVLYTTINLTPNDNNSLIRIKFSNFDGKYKEGDENNYLSTSINSNTINFSQIEFMDVDFINFKPSKFLQNKYTAYTYPNRSPIFANN